MQNSFLIDQITNSLPGPKRRAPHGGFNINCPMCVTRGHPRPDTKFRCGVRTFGDGALAINCFNCGMRTRWSPGQLLNKNIKAFLQHLGVNELDIKKLNFTAWQLTHTIEGKAALPDNSFNPHFERIELPENSFPLWQWAVNECEDPDFLEVSQYAMTRGDVVFDNHEFYWSPSKAHGINRRLIVPFYWKNEVVGWVGRSVDAKAAPRYYTNTPAHYLFNNHNLYRDRKFVILVEGIFDALSVDGVATQGAKLSEQQAYWLNGLDKKIIVLPDRDEKGQNLIDLALKHEYMVSFPQWDDGIKDANDAVLKYGKLWTIHSIIQGATDNKLKINLLRKKW